MARVTVEDCIKHIPNRFELVIIAAQRAKQIASGTPLTIDRDNDKDAVVSLREIGGKTIDLNQIRADIIQSFRKKQSYEAPAAEENAEVRELLAEEGAQVEDDVSEHLSVGVGVEGKSGLSFEGDNIDVED